MDKIEFYREIVDCLVKYGNLSNEDAQLLLSKSNIYKSDTDDDFELISHETPYYWAMWLLYAKENPDWHKNPKLWPPPKDYLDKWYSSK